MQSAQSAKGRGRESSKRGAGYGTTVRSVCLRKCISFLIFFRRKIEMRFIYYVFHFEFALSLSLSLLRSSQRYLHSSPSIHSASLEKVSTIEWQIHMYMYSIYVFVSASLSVCLYVHVFMFINNSQSNSAFAWQFN